MSGGRQEVIYLEVSGLRRRYVLYCPASVGANNGQTSVLLMLDGRGGTPWTGMRTALWNATADREGFAVIYPEALRLDPEGPQHFLTNPQMWCAGSGGSDVERSGVDDVEFLRRVIEDASNHLRVNTQRVFMSGFSNGAAMAYRFALAHPGLLAGIAPVSGHYRGPPDATLRVPVPMIGFFGRQDPLSPFDGGEVDLPWGRRETRPAALDSARQWASLCGHPRNALQHVEQDGVARWSCGKPGARDEIRFVAIDGLGHVWPGGHRILPESLVGHGSERVRANDEIWSFFTVRPARD